MYEHINEKPYVATASWVPAKPCPGTGSYAPVLLSMENL